MSKRTLDEPNLCPLCLEDVNESLEIHFSKEHREFQCSFCAKNFPNQTALDLHVKNKHDDITCILNCPVCHADFDQADLLQAHINSHFSTLNHSNKTHLFYFKLKIYLQIDNISKSNLQDICDIEHEMLKVKNILKKFNFYLIKSQQFLRIYFIKD